LDYRPFFVTSGFTFDQSTATPVMGVFLVGGVFETEHKKSCSSCQKNNPQWRSAVFVGNYA